MVESLHGQARTAISREVAFVTLVAIFVSLPAFFELGIAAWVFIGSLLAFAVVHPRALIFAVPAIIPLSFRAVVIGDLQFNMIEILVAVAAIGYLPRVAVTAWRNRKISTEVRHTVMRQVVPDRLAAGIALLTVLAGAVALIWMADPLYGAESLRTLRWTVLVPVAYFFLAAPVIQQNEVFRSLAAILFLAGALVTSLIAVGDGVLGGGVDAGVVTRLSGIAPHPNALALILDRAAVLGLLIALLFRSSFSRLWLYPALFVTVVAVLTFSRGAILAMAGALVLIMILSRSRAAAAAIAGITAIGISGFIAVAPERALSLLGGGSGSLRLELWNSSVEMIRDHPVTGVGPDQFLYQYLPRYVTPEAWPERFTSHPHNLVLDTWLSLGIIGLVVISLVTVLFVRHARVALQTRDRISVAAAGALIVVALHGMVDHSYFLPELAMSTWLLLILLNPGERSEEPPDG